eukprot:COSAG01_NODE_57099_length_314_cov_1.116279_1_plen_47_part_10
MFSEFVELANSLEQLCSSRCSEASQVSRHLGFGWNGARIMHARFGLH